MNQDYPVPPAELVEQWREEAPPQFSLERERYIATQAARWGADQELELCCEWLKTAAYGDTLGSYSTKDVATDLRAARRPKPPSLKAQALHTLKSTNKTNFPIIATVLTADQHALIRRALEALDD